MLEGPANPSGMQRAHLKDVTLRRDEKSVEVTDKQRVARRPSRKRVSKPLKRKDLNEKWKWRRKSRPGFASSKHAAE